jgi:hypothetical protein
MELKSASIINLALFIIFLLEVSCSFSWERSDGSPDIPSDLTDVSCPEGTTPQDESCNGRDDDCDGLIDEDFDCPRFQLVPCTTSCGSEGQGPCTADCQLPVSCQPPVETCNGLDDDCDGIADNGYDCVMGDTRDCSTSCGSGTQTCLEGTCRWGTCVGAGDCNAGDSQDCTFMLSCGHGTWICDETCHWPDVCPGSPRPEVCDGDNPPHDNDCDTVIDNGVKVKILEDIRVTRTGAPSEFPLILWAGSEFFIAWDEGTYASDPALSARQVYAAILDEEGAKIGGDIPVTNSSWDHYFAIPVFVATEIGIFWSDYRSGSGYDVYMARVNVEGAIIDNDILIVNSTGSASFAGPVWDGAHYGLTWQDTRADPGAGDVFFQMFTPSGAVFSSLVNVTGSVGMREEMPMRPLWTGTEFIALYTAFNSSNIPHCQMARFSPEGVMAGSPINVIEENSLVCVPTWIVSTDDPPFTGFALTWMTAESPGDSALRFGLFNPDGTPAAGPITVYNASTSSMNPIPNYNAYQNNSVGISWVEQDWTAGGECWFAEVNVNPSDLHVVTEPMPVSQSGGQVYTICSNAWTGSAYGLAWQDRRDDPAAAEIYFALVGCP